MAKIYDIGKNTKLDDVEKIKAYNQRMLKLIKLTKILFTELTEKQAKLKSVIHKTIN